MTDLKLVMDYDSTPLTPFYYFVAPETLPFQGPNVFHRFMDLPVEIHRLIFRYCDTPSLFHLMHTSSYTRSECSDLFWEPVDSTWYRCEYSFQTLSSEGVFFPIYHCPEFASCITQVEVHVDFPNYDITAQRSRAFWGTLLNLFPSLQNVVLSGNTPQQLEPPAAALTTAEHDERYFPISDFANLAPPHITVFIAFKYGADALAYHRRWHEFRWYQGAVPYSLWKIGAGGSWNMAQDPWIPMRVLLPAKRIPQGVLNDFLSIQRVRLASLREEEGLDWLCWDTYVQHSTDGAVAAGGVLDCPVPGCCDSKSRTLVELKMHVWNDPHHDECGQNFNRYGIVNYHPHTPPEQKTLLDAKKCRIDDMRLIVAGLIEELSEQYFQSGEAGRRPFNATLTRQLRGHGYLDASESLYDFDFWREFYHNLLEDDTRDAHHPDERDLDGRDYPVEEELPAHDEFAGEEYMTD